MDNNKKAHIEEFKKYILARALKEGKDPSKYTEDELKSMYLDFMKLKTQKAAHGAKLQYFKSLKNQCPEGEELYYYKKGGSVGCGCKKKENGGEIEKKSSIIDKFKTIRKASLGDTLGRIADATGSQGGFRRASKEKPSKKIIKPKTTKPASGPKDFKNDYSSQRVKDSEKDYLEGNADHKVKKNCGGSKMKLQKKGGEVCPKCGKVHSAGIGCAVAKFKAYRKGGSLNGVPFYLGGTPKGGIQDNTRVQRPIIPQVFVLPLLLPQIVIEGIRKRTLPELTVMGQDLSKTYPFPYGEIIVEKSPENGKKIAYPTTTSPLGQLIMRSKAIRGARGNKDGEIF